MEIIKETFSNFGVVEWSMFATVFCELALILFYNKGILKAKDKIEAYEKELRECRKENDSLKATNQRLLDTFEERSEN